MTASGAVLRPWPRTGPASVRVDTVTLPAAPLAVRRSGPVRGGPTDTGQLPPDHETPSHETPDQLTPDHGTPGHEAPFQLVRLLRPAAVGGGIEGAAPDVHLAGQLFAVYRQVDRFPGALQRAQPRRRPPVLARPGSGWQLQRRRPGRSGRDPAASPVRLAPAGRCPAGIDAWLTDLADRARRGRRGSRGMRRQRTPRKKLATRTSTKSSVSGWSGSRSR